MGDFVEISHVDLEGSLQFLKRFVVSQKLVPHIQLIESRKNKCGKFSWSLQWAASQRLFSCICVTVDGILEHKPPH